VRPILKPKALRLGDTLALVTPASGVSEQKELDDARKNLEVLGFQVKIGAHAADSWGDFGGTDQHRADDLNAAFADPEVNGIIAYTGGYGCGRIVDLLNYDSFRENPKVVIGYSDITGLDLALYARSGVVTFYGPVASSGFKGFEEENFQKVLKEPEPAGLLTPPSVPLGNPPNPAAATLHPGTVTGRLVGGNLSLIASLIGSPYLPDLSGHILFVEDIGEEPYRVDRMLNSLRISKSIKGVRGIVLATSALAESNPKSRQTQAEALP
jgi:muramoyltetrapeptide carboxypeptidase